MKKQDGYIALMTVLIVGAACTTVSLALLVAGVDGQRTALVQQRSLQARSLAQSCMDEALQTVHDAIAYTGTNNLSLGQGTCTYTVTSTGASTRSISVTGTVGSAVRRAVATITIGATTITVDTWKEIDLGIAATPAFVQVTSSTPQSTVSSVAVTMGTQTAGNTNVLAVGFDDTTTTIVSVTDTAGNTYLPATALTRGTGMSQIMYYAKNITGGTPTVTVTFSAATPFPDLRVMEYSGLDATAPLDTAAANIGLNNPSNSGNLTTTYATSLIVSAGYIQNSFSAPGAGYTQRIITSPNGDIVEDRVVTSAGTYNATATASGNWVMQAVAFRAAGQ